MIFLFSSLLLAAPNENTPGPKKGRIVAVYDGDTFTLSNGDKIRLVGVNTPELRPKEEFGLAARDAVADILINEEVYLTYGAVPRDSYGRLIASVRTEDTDIGEFLLREGLGHLFLIPPEGIDREKYLQAQTEAQNANKGIWSLSRYQSNLHLTSFHANAPGIDNDNINGEYLRVCNTTAETLNVAGYTITDLQGNSWEFPELHVPPGHTFKVFSGRGRTQSNPEKQLEIYLGSYRPIWNNEHDRASIYDPNGALQDSRLHKPKTKPKQ